MNSEQRKGRGVPGPGELDPAGIRVGIDLVEIRRIDTSDLGEAFRRRVLSVAEQELASALSGVRLAEFVAGRFAAKEAVLKALRLPSENGDVMRDIEVLTRDDGSPFLVLTGEANYEALKAGAGRGQVSISHTGGFACAIALFRTHDGDPNARSDVAQALPTDYDTTPNELTREAID